MGLNYQMLLKGVDKYNKFTKFDEAYKKYVLDQRQVWIILVKLVKMT